nr:DedA family protein [Actinomycetales bacterium]
MMEWMGSFGVALLVALENLFPPIPSEIILPLAGFTASLGSFHLVSAIAWATVGSVVGAMALYYVGLALGRERTRKIMGALPLVNARDIERTEAWFDKHGSWTVLLGRLIPIFRSLISIPAGVTRMPIPKFLLLTFVGSVTWNTILVSAGFLLGENWHLVEPVLEYWKYAVVAVVAIALVWFVIAHLRAKRAAGDKDEESVTGTEAFSGAGAGSEAGTGSEAGAVSRPETVSRPERAAGSEPGLSTPMVAGSPE